LSVIVPLKIVDVGIVVERSKSASPWADFLWRPVTALAGAPETPAWTKLSDDGERATFFVGAEEIELYRSEAGNYRQNLLVEAPLLWVALRPTGTDPPYKLSGVTADPAEGEAWAGLGNDLVDTVAMPAAVLNVVADFVAEYYAEQPFQKRTQDHADLEALGRHAPTSGKP
jgi:hypothetical protein